MSRPMPEQLSTVIYHLGQLLQIFSFVLLVPLVFVLLTPQGAPEVSSWCYLIPAIVAAALGAIFVRSPATGRLSNRASMLVCALGWIVVSILGAIPLWIGLRVGFLDCCFETVSGFTTTGITMLRGLDAMPRSILFWRAFTQWLGGLGILTFFLAISFTGGSAAQLYSAESHKIFSHRPTPGIFNTLRILWAIYAGFTALITALLALEGVGLFDALLHSFTALATGGFSSHDASVDFFRIAGYRHFVAIEYTLVVGMLMGGVSYMVHYRALTGRLRALWDNFEMRLFWCILAGSVYLVMVDRIANVGFSDLSESFRASLFQVTSILTTTGFATRDIASPYFPSLAKQLFLVLMVIGGCVGSTGGGIKVLRVGILAKMVARQIRLIIHGPSAVNLAVVDGQVVDNEEVRRVSALFFAWAAMLVVGAGVTAFLSNHGPFEAASGMFSALGNIGPCYIPGDQMAALHPAVKIVYMIGMLAGRLEILPILLLFSPRTWR